MPVPYEYQQCWPPFCCLLPCQVYVVGEQGIQLELDLAGVKHIGGPVSLSHPDPMFVLPDSHALAGLCALIQVCMYSPVRMHSHTVCYRTQMLHDCPCKYTDIHGTIECTRLVL